jgi:hypothetical protein
MTEMFWMFLITSSSAFALAVFKMCYKSKCSDINLCCLKIRRDVVTEEKEMEFVTTHTRPESEKIDDEHKV